MYESIISFSLVWVNMLLYITYIKSLIHDHMREGKKNSVGHYFLLFGEKTYVIRPFQIKHSLEFHLCELNIYE